ncbi:MAG: hypothetical protein P0Y56_10005 [Candidatus Andeanibacterium colombiense]|uniref:Uncharacterized protein n=1 Tax=Candidatus Andeanibacterium colombiense TaxID=3121345 RepID=A0AAJ6BLH5_9SPHN|nr:MAG: hypothetical protein P0Y56_10005 [Sphingomonadaceae bacterium]
MNRLHTEERTPWGRIALVWLVFATLLLALAWTRIRTGAFPDPDDTLRLVQVRDLLAGQNWFDLHQYRIDPGASPIMHWSRLVDVPLAATMLLLRPLLGAAHAELVATVAVPLLTLAVVLAAAGHIATRLCGRNVAVLACLVCGMSPPLLSQLQPLRIDHHGWEVVTVLLALAALMTRRPWRGGALAGIALAAGLSISLEILPLAAAFGAVLLLRWLRDPRERGWLAAFLASLALALAGLFALTRGFGDLIDYCDVVSPPYMAFFALAALGPLAAATKPRLPLGAMLGIVGIAGLAGVAVFVHLAPQCLAGPFGNLDPLVREYWYDHVLEGRPVWLQPYDQAIPAVLQGLIALAAAVALWRKSAPGPNRDLRVDYLLLLAAAFAAGLMTWRSMDFACAIASAPLGWAAYRLLLRFRSARTPKGRLGATLAAIMVLLPSTPVAIARVVAPTTLPEAQVAIRDSGCDLHEQAAALDRFAPVTVFAPLDVSATVLERTRDGVIATSHHRAQMAMHDVILAFTSPEAQAHAIVLRHHAGYLAICTDLGEAKLYSRPAPGGLMAQLVAGKAPEWLEPVAIGQGTTFRVWKVRG